MKTKTSKDKKENLKKTKDRHMMVAALLALIGLKFIKDEINGLGSAFLLVALFFLWRGYKTDLLIKEKEANKKRRKPRKKVNPYVKDIGDADVIILCYPNCTTCKKAKKWLEENNISYYERHIAEENPTYEELKEWHQKSGVPLKRFFNTSGMIYRDMNLSKKLPHMSEEEQLRLLATNGMLVRRPILIKDEMVLVGFKEAEWDRLKGEKV